MTVVIIFVALPVKVYALVTMNKQGWLTRSAGSQGGEGQSEASLGGEGQSAVDVGLLPHVPTGAGPADG
ncbi:hypothetical protein [Microbacterium testaceum]|uniref:hypothetical protein n=1 Tax=Microbacterium testaceum TaxID=2033 RepID=UPI00380C1D9D